MTLQYVRCILIISEQIGRLYFWLLTVHFGEKGWNKLYLTDKQVIAIKRKRGELNLSTVALGRELGLSRWTLDNIFKRNHRKVTPATYKKLSDWLIDEYATADINDSKAVATQDK